MSARQGELLEKPPRRMRGQLMHVCDVDGGCGGPDGPVYVYLQCGKCEHQSPRHRFETVTEAKRGLPCPKCSSVPERT